MIVELFVKRSDKDRNVRVTFSDPLNALRRRDQCHEANVFVGNAALVEYIKSVDCRIASREHRVDHDEETPLSQIEY